MDFAGNHALRFNLDATFGENHAIEPPGDHNAVPFNLALDFGAFAKDDCLLRDDVPFYVAVNAKRASDRERSLECHALVDEPCPFFAACALWCCAGPLPRHGNPPRKTPPTLAACADKSTQLCDAVVESGDAGKRQRGLDAEYPHRYFIRRSYNPISCASS